LSSDLLPEMVPLKGQALQVCLRRIIPAQPRTQTARWLCPPPLHPRANPPESPFGKGGREITQRGCAPLRTPWSKTWHFSGVGANLVFVQ
jgi:hypothetical protein